MRATAVEPGSPTAEAEAEVAASRSLSGKVAAVTGGGGVIGAGIAARFVAAGARVALGDIDAERVVAAAERLGRADVAVGIRVDVTDQGEDQRFIEAAVAAFGRLDILVNAAGITHVDPLLEVSGATWRKVFAVNLEGPLFCLQAAAAIMRDQMPDPSVERRGTIINIGSQGSEFPIPTSTAYGASKRALIYLTETAAVDLQPAAIAVSTILPGMVYEGMWKSVNATRSKLRGEDLADRIRLDLRETPTGRFQPAAELADIALYAASSVGLGLSGKTIWSEAHVA